MAKRNIEQWAEETRALRFELHRLVYVDGMTPKQGMLALLPDDRNRTHKLRAWSAAGLWPLRDEELEQARAMWPESDSESETVPTDNPQDASAEQPHEPHEGHGRTDESDSAPTISSLTDTPGTGPTERGGISMTDATSTGHTEQAETNPTEFDSLPSLGSGMTECPTNPTNCESLIRSVVRDELSSLIQSIEVKGVPRPGRGGGKRSIKKSFALPTEVWSEFVAMFGDDIASHHVAAALTLYMRMRRGEE
jgi:hypothetical protein